MDDTSVFGKDQEEHNWCLNKVSEIIRMPGLTFNWNKYAG